MYTNFRIHNYRGFKEIELKDLARVNLIGGKNNVGKTSLLEALFILMNPYNPELFLRVNALRGVRQIRVDKNSLETPLDSLFYDFDSNQQVSLYGSTSTGNEYCFDISVQLDIDEVEAEKILSENISQEAASSLDANTIVPIKIRDIEGNERIARVISDDGSMRYVSPNVRQRHPSFYFASIVRENFEVIAERYSNIVDNKQDQLILETLQHVESRIKSIRLLYQNGEPMLTADIGSDRQMPLVYMGDGLNRLLSFILAIGNAKNGIVLIDEIENGLHYSVLPDVWKAISKAANLFNTQVIATTHSMEMIRAAQQAFANTGEDDFRYYRLDRDAETGIPLAVKYTQKTMDAAMEMGYEVRG